MDLEDILVTKNALQCHIVRKVINQELQKEFSPENNIATELCEKTKFLFSLLLV